MLGPSHATSGAAVFLGAASVLPGYGELEVPGLFAGTVCAMGAALVPDLDTETSSAAKALPPVSKIGHKALSIVGGAHRKGTHSLLFIALLCLLGYCGHSFLPSIDVFGWNFAWFPALLVGFMGAFAASAYHLWTKFGAWWAFLVGLVAGGFLVSDAYILVFVVPLGIATHIVGDTLTTRGVPWFWPIIRKNLRLPILGDTGSSREKILHSILIAASVVLLLVRCVELITR